MHQLRQHNYFYRSPHEPWLAYHKYVLISVAPLDGIAIDFCARPNVPRTSLYFFLSNFIGLSIRVLIFNIAHQAMNPLPISICQISVFILDLSKEPSIQISYFISIKGRVGNRRPLYTI